MSSERWHRAEELVHGALGVAPDERGAWLARACGEDDSMRAYVERLLACESPSRDFLETPAVSLGAPRSWAAESSDALEEGQRVGTYLIVRELGRGGMGAVYLARRDDDEFRKYVAVKVVRRGMDSADILRRFRNERQILAALDHPNIARLLDGGTTHDGLPYLVMEYVEGTPITRYCDRHRLTTGERLQLFRTVCAAVQHAHQNLVVHRDLKPSNILITADGTPKLLDFGIAKILNPALSSLPMERTRTELRVLTPAYASPEQVRGEKMTTVSDVYSLGVLLYELLAGHRPYRADGAPPHEMARVICQQEPARPGVAAARAEVVRHEGGEPDTTITPEIVARDRNTQPDRLRRQLAGDLDNIVLMALRKEPQRRYVSAEQLSADIQRHLDGLTVSARKDTFSYRATKFVSRHRGGVVAAVLIVLALTAGLAAAAWEARVARAERARADRRFNDVRKLAHSNLFELHDAIANLPGSTPARELLVKRSLEYLDSLAQESGDDPSLQREIVSAYLKVGNVLGNPNNANLGDPAGAMQSYGKALAIDQKILAANPADREAYRLLAVVNEKMSDVQAATGDMRGAVESSARSLSIFGEIAESRPAEAPAQISLAISHIKRGDVLGNPDFPNAGDREGATGSYRAALLILERAGQGGADDARARRLRGLVNERLGTMLATQGRIDEAADAYRKSLAIREALAAENPSDVDAVRDVAIAYEKTGDAQEARGDFAAALESRRKSLGIFRGLVEADEQNVQARQSLALSHLHLGDLLANAKVGQRAEAQKNYRAALDILEQTAGADSKTEELRARARERLGREEKAAGK